MEQEEKRREEEQEEEERKKRERGEDGKAKKKKKKKTEEGPLATVTEVAITTKTSPNKKKGGEGEEKLNILELTSSTFSEKVSTGQWLVEFYSPLCSACQAFEPTWTGVAKALANRKSDGVGGEGDAVVRVARVNVDNDDRLRKYYLVKTVPTLKFIFNGRIAHFEVREDMKVGV